MSATHAYVYRWDPMARGTDKSNNDFCASWVLLSSFKTFIDYTSGENSFFNLNYFLEIYIPVSLNLPT